LTVLAIVVSGCATGTGKRETSALLDAVDGYRRADVASSRATRAQVLESVTCTEATVCGAKDVCVEAVRATSRALLLKDEVAARLADVEQKRLAPDDPRAAALPGKLDEAQQLLGQGRERMTECERRLSELRVEFGS
jgi:hypothetical protein